MQFLRDRPKFFETVQSEKYLHQTALSLLICSSCFFALYGPEIYETLAALRTSLLGRIQLEQLYSRHPGHPPHHQTLIAQLDQQLNILLHANTEDPKTETARLLHDAVELGIQVHREMRRL